MDQNQPAIKYLGAPKDLLLSKNNEGESVPVTLESAIEANVKLIFVYFSMHQCGPCREFTPILAALYHE